jgi:hypothetical protein
MGSVMKSIVSLVMGGGGSAAPAAPAPAPAPAPAAPEKPPREFNNPLKNADTGAVESSASQTAKAGKPQAASSDTMLTGQVGVDPASLALGKNTLLGG